MHKVLGIELIDLTCAETPWMNILLGRSQLLNNRLQFIAQKSGHICLLFIASGIKFSYG